jgi:hypothetical protein
VDLFVDKVYDAHFTLNSKNVFFFRFVIAVNAAFHAKMLHLYNAVDKLFNGPSFCSPRPSRYTQRSRIGKQKKKN